MSVGHRLAEQRKGPFGLDTRIIDDTEKRLLRKVRVVRIYDVPFGAGYSRDGKTIYIDRMMPTGFVYKGRNVRTDKYLILHECVEKALIDKYGLHYLVAHQPAERAEESAIEADGVPDAVYDAFMNKHLNAVYRRGNFDRCPPDLDLTPYLDTKDKVIDQMKFAKAA